MHLPHIHHMVRPCVPFLPSISTPGGNASLHTQAIMVPSGPDTSSVKSAHYPFFSESLREAIIQDILLCSKVPTTEASVGALQPDQGLTF